MITAFDRLLRSVAGLPDLRNVLENKYNLNVLLGDLSGKMILHVSRPGGAIGASMCDVIQEQATLSIIDHEMKVIAKAPEKAYPISDPFCDIKHINDHNPAYIRDWIDGTLVMVSKQNSTYLISTKTSVHATEMLNDTNLVTQRVVLRLLERANYYRGVDALFDVTEVPALDKLTYTFIIAPKNGIYTNDWKDYELYLISAWNRETTYPASVPQLCSLSRQLNIQMPENQKIYSFKQAYAFMEERYKRTKNTKGVILTDMEGSTASVPFVEEENVKLESMPEENSVYVNKIIPFVEPFLSGNYAGILCAKEKNKKLMEELYRHYNVYIDDVRDTFKKFRNSRSKKAFAARVKEHKFKTVLYALYEGKIESAGRAIKVLPAKHFAKFVLSEDGGEIIKLLEKGE